MMPKESLLDYIKRKKEVEMYLFTPREKESELDKARGTTDKMHRYCAFHGLGDIADLDIIWKESNKQVLFKIGGK